MDSKLKRFAPLAAAVGVVGLLAAAVIWLLQRQFTTAAQASLAVGLLGLALAILFNPAVVQTWLGGRQARYGGNVAVMVLALLGILVVVNYLAVQNPKRWDWSQDQLNTLAPETLNVLQQLAQPAHAVGFYSAGFASSQTTAERLLERYRIESDGQFTYEFHDPNAEPLVAREYGVERDGTLIIEMGDSREEISFASEDEVTGALIRLANPTTRRLYFTTGHGEREAADTGDEGLSRAVDILLNQNYEALPLNLAVSTTVPSDARAVVVAGPIQAFVDEEVAALRSYAEGGGSLVVLLDSVVETRRELTGTEPLIEYLTSAWGLSLPNDLVVDLSNSAQGQPLLLFAAAYGTSPITRDLTNILTLYPAARSVKGPEAGVGDPNLVYTDLVQAGPAAWGETDFDALQEGQYEQGEGDTLSPLNLAMTVENTQTGARLVVVGDSNFASNAFGSQGANELVFANSVNWATVEEDLINLTPKVPTTRSMELVGPLTTRLVFLVTVVLLPLAVLGLGGLVWLQRRRHV